VAAESPTSQEDPATGPTTILVGIADRRCTNLESGLRTIGCAFPETVSISGRSPSTLTVDFAANVEPAQITLVGLSIFMQVDPDNPVVIECSSDDSCRGFFGADFVAFDGDWFGATTSGASPPSTRFVEREGRFESGFQMSIPDAVTVDGLAVDGGPDEVQEIRIFVDTADGLSSTNLLDLGALRAYFS
jgi:hypothetical protein